MTYSAIPALRHDPRSPPQWEPRLTLPDYDGGALCGMAMTEKQGGSDVRANATEAHARPATARTSSPGTSGSARTRCATSSSSWRRRRAGCRASSSSAGPGFEIQRLKDKLGTRSLASSEVEFRGVPARMLGEEGRGVADDHRHGHAHAPGLHHRLGDRHALRRRPRRLARAPPRRVRPHARRSAADEATCSPTCRSSPRRRPRRRMRLARAYDESDQALRRFATAVLKYWVCKRATAARGRGARVPRRQRLRRGGADGAAAARQPAQRDLGGLGQRDVARRPARDGARARGRCRRSWPSASWRAAPTRAWTRTSTRCPASSRRSQATPSRRSGRRGARSRTSRSRSRRRC